MEIPKFTEDEDTHEINPMELLRMARESGRNASMENIYSSGESWEW